MGVAAGEVAGAYRRCGSGYSGERVAVGEAVGVAVGEVVAPQWVWWWVQR